MGASLQKLLQQLTVGQSNTPTCALLNPACIQRSGDATARIWDLTPGPSCGTARVLDHPPGDDSSKGKDVTTLEWDPDGVLLATGAYDGKARVWTKEGERVGPGAG